MTDCIFCDIACKRAQAHIVLRDGPVLAFADHAPIRPGHLQIMPEAHFESFEQVPEALSARLIALGQRLARAIKAEYGVARVAFVISGNDIAHVHAHLVPLVAPTDITSARYLDHEAPRFRGLPKATAAELLATSQAIAARLGMLEDRG